MMIRLAWIAVCAVCVDRASANTFELISTPEDPTVLGVFGDRHSSDCALNSTGRYVVFESQARQLVADDSNGESDIFLRDRTSGTTRRISLTSDGGQLSDGSFDPVISPDGSHVAFGSRAPELSGVPGADTQIYLANVASGAITLVSRRPDGSASSGGSIAVLALSRDGRYVVFNSERSDLVPGDTNDARDVFRFDRDTLTVERVSVDATGTQADAGTGYPARISADGNRISFESASSNLVPGDSNGETDVFVKAMGSGNIVRVSLTSTGAQIAGDSWMEDASGDGLEVLFATSVDAVVPGDTDGRSDLYLHRIGPGTTERVSVDAGGNGSGASHVHPAMNRDATRVAFSTDSTVWFPDAVSDYLAVKDLVTGDIERLTPPINGTVLNNIALSRDGQIACFSTNATNLAANDWNQANDLFVVDIAGTIELVSRAGTPLPMHVGDDGSYSPDVSADGRKVVFLTDALFIDPREVGEAEPRAQMILADPDLGTRLAIPPPVAPVRADKAGKGSVGRISNPSISPSGRYVAFDSTQGDLVLPPMPPSTGPRVFRYDTLTDETIRLSDDDAENAIAADDGSVVFESGEPLLASDGNGVLDIYRWSPSLGLRRISETPDGQDPDARSDDADVSADGNTIVFSSSATNLVSPPLTAAESHVYLHDVVSGVTRLISRNPVSTLPGEDYSSAPAVSADGRWIAFYSAADNLVEGDDADYDVFLYDRDGNGLQRVSAGIGALGLEVYDAFVGISPNAEFIVMYLQRPSDYSLYLGRYQRSNEELVLVPVDDYDSLFAIDDAGTIVAEYGAALEAEDDNLDVDVYRVVPGNRVFADSFE